MFLQQFNCAYKGHLSLGIARWRLAQLIQQGLQARVRPLPLLQDAQEGHKPLGRRAHAAHAARCAASWVGRIDGRDAGAWLEAGGEVQEDEGGQSALAGAAHASQTNLQHPGRQS